MKKVLILLGLSLASVIQAASVAAAGGKLEFVDGKVEFSVPGSSTKTIFTPVARGAAQGPFSAVVINEKNARALENGGGAVVLLEHDCTGQKLMEEITALLSDSERCGQMRKALHKMCVFDSAERLCDVIAELGGA